MLISRTDPIPPSLDDAEDAVFESVKRVMPAKLSRNPHIIEIMLAQSLVFNPW